MKFASYLSQLASAVDDTDAGRLIELLHISSRSSKELLKDTNNTSRAALQGFKGVVPPPWDEIAISHLQVMSNVAARNHAAAYKEQAKMVTDLRNWFSSQSAWFLPVLYLISDDLRDLATQADQDVFEHGGPSKQPQSLEDAARVIGTCFTACIMDRQNPLNVSRKWGVYHTATLAIKCYFRVHKANLSKNIIRAIDANSEGPNGLPPLDRYPRAHQVTWKYYMALLDFLKEDYEKAEPGFEFAFYNCPASAQRNKELALTHLIPMRFLRGILPSRFLLSRFPRLNEIYGPFADAIRRGDIKEFDARLAWAEVRLVEMGLFLVVERAREVCLSRLFRKTWVALSNPTPLTRVPISSFRIALQISGMGVSVEEVECLLANMIYKGYIRGYLSHQHGLLVLSKAAPFVLLQARKDPAPL